MTARFVRLPVAAAPCVARTVSSAIDEVLRTIDASFSQPLSLDTLAAVAGLSVSRFTARFRNEVGLSPHRYLCLVRVRRAQDLLCDGLAPSLVATEVGFFRSKPSVPALSARARRHAARFRDRTSRRRFRTTAVDAHASRMPRCVPAMPPSRSRFAPRLFAQGGRAAAVTVMPASTPACLPPSSRDAQEQA